METPMDRKDRYIRPDPSSSLLQPRLGLSSVKAIGEVPSVKQGCCPIKDFNKNAMKNGAEY